jgi:hypothetical protein
VQVYLHNLKPVSPCISWWRRKFSSVCASISVSVWGKLVLKCTKCCKQLLESPVYANQRHLSDIPVSKVDANPLKMTPTQAGSPPPTPRRPWHVCEKSFVLIWRTIREVAEEVRIPFGMCQKILTEDLQMRHVTAKFVRCLLTAEQEDTHVSIYTDLHDRVQNDPNFMSSVITGDECWVYGYDPET